MAVRHVERHPLCPRRSLSTRWLRPSRAARSDSRRSARGLACPVSVVVPRGGLGPRHRQGGVLPVLVGVRAP